MKPLAALLAALAMTAQAAATRPWTDAEIAYIDRLPSPGPRLSPAPGAEYLIISTFHDRSSHLLPLRSELGSREHQLLQAALCRAEAVVLGRARAPLGRMNSEQTTIHSKVDFDLVEVFKAGAGWRAGDVVPVLRRGGHAWMDDGRQLHVKDVATRPYAEDRSYLLLLSRAHPSSPFYETGDVSVAVEGGHLALDTEHWFHLRGGERWADVQADVRRLLGAPCA